VANWTLTSQPDSGFKTLPFTKQSAAYTGGLLLLSATYSVTASTKKRGFSTLASMNDGDTDGLDVVSRPTKRTKSRKNKKAAAAAAAAAAETTSQNLSAFDDDSEFVTISDYNKLKKQFSELFADLQSQKKIVADLKTRLSSVTSLLNINDGTAADANRASSSISSFAAAVKHPAAAAVAADRQVQETVIAAVYVDNQRRLSRATNLVITGLEASSTLSDQQAVVDLCSTEFNEIPDVTYCKRLGKPIPGRVQPLLVVLKSVDQATRFLSTAKYLRQSANELTRHNVYISANLTKAEARAAYELRCERRRAAERRTNQQQQRSQPVMQQLPQLSGQTQQLFQMSSSPHIVVSAAPRTTSSSTTIGNGCISTPALSNGANSNFLPSPGGQMLILDATALHHHPPTVVSPPTYLSLPPGTQQQTQWHIDQQNQHVQQQHQQLQLHQNWQQQQLAGSQHTNFVVQQSQNPWQQQSWHQAAPRQSTSAPISLTQQQPV
jgi:hypothetical protein